MEKTIWIGSLSSPIQNQMKVVPKTALYMPRRPRLPLS
jgi:hypothetical protein